MARGNLERKGGRHRHTTRVADRASELVVLRFALDGMTGSDPAFDDTLTQAETTAADMFGMSTRMDRGAFSRRAACEALVAHTAARQIVEF